MFTPKTKRIEKIGEKEPKRIKELEGIFSGVTNIYIDYANVRPWSEKLGWHIEAKRLKQFLNSFDNINEIKFYVGELTGNIDSKRFINTLKKCKYEVRTKPVKIMNMSIDASSVSSQSTDLVKQFIRSALIKKYDVATIEYLNNKFREMNRKGEYFIKDRKCNFDVEIGRDIEIDQAQNNIDTFVLWSGDSDFAEPVEKLLDNGKNVILFATARRVSSELNSLKPKGLRIFDIKKIRNFICWAKEIEQNILSS